MSNTTPSAIISSEKITVDALVCSTLGANNTDNVITLVVPEAFTIYTISSLDGDLVSLSSEENTKLTQDTTYAAEIATNSLTVQEGSSSIAINSSISIDTTEFTVSSLQTSLNDIKIPKSEKNSIILNIPYCIYLSMTKEGENDEWHSTCNPQYNCPNIIFPTVSELEIQPKIGYYEFIEFTVKENKGTATIDQSKLATTTISMTNIGIVTCQETDSPRITNLETPEDWNSIEGEDLNKAINRFVRFTYGDTTYTVYYVPNTLYKVGNGNYIDLKSGTIYTITDAYHDCFFEWKYGANVYWEEQEDESDDNK